MAARPLMLATLLGASIGVPYYVSRSSQGPEQAPASATQPATGDNSSWSSWFKPETSTNPSFPPPPLMSSATATSAAQPVYPTTATPAALAGLENIRPGEPVRYHRIQDVFRFDVSKEWVYQNWDRKSTGLGDPGLFGIRVALVTGTERGDLAGALTYLFDENSQLQHISFRGRTADTRPLVQYLMERYKFERMEPPAGEQLYQVRSGSSVYSELRTRPESVLLEEAPNGSIGVVLELGRPGSNRPLQPPVPQLNIPEAAAPTPSAETASDAADKAAEKPGMIGKFGPATQVQHNQVLEHRWPD
jgi:Family of unknown function (DUF6690)